MKIIVLRHEERGSQSDFDSPLTERGVLNSSHLPCTFQKKSYYFDEIYSSPYIRCIQTILPTASVFSKSIKIDNSLCEYHIDPNEHQTGAIILRPHTDIEKDLFNLDSNYQSVLNFDTYFNKYKNGRFETTQDVVKRVWHFVENIFSESNKDSTVLIATHMSIVNIICFILNSKQTHDDNLDTILENCKGKQFETEFPMGHFVEFLFET